MKFFMKTMKNPEKKPLKTFHPFNGIALLKRAFILLTLVGSLSVETAFAMWGPSSGQELCLSELELAALFSKPQDGSSTRKGKIRKANKEIEKWEKNIEKINDRINEKEKAAEDSLENFTGSLDEAKLKTDQLHSGYKTTVTPPGDVPREPIEIIESYVSERSKNFGGCPSPGAEKENNYCYKWQLDQSGDSKNSLFKNNGKISKSFCDQFAINGEAKDCKDQLKAATEAYEELDEYKKKMKARIDKLEKRIADLEDNIEVLDEEVFNAELDGEEEETEAGGLCTRCLADLRSALGPSPWQKVGSGLTAALGIGLSYFGLRESRRAQNSTNRLLALQGMPAENNFGYSLAGLSLGYPLVSQGLYGLSRGGMSQGGYGCSPKASPHSAYMMQMQQMQQMQYQSMMGSPWGMGNPMMGGNPWGMMNPMMGAQFQMGGGPWGMGNPMMGGPWGMMNPMMQAQFQMGGNPWGMMNPMMGAQFQMGGGPWGMGNPMAMMNPMMGMQFQAMSPWGMNPMMPGVHNPWMGGNNWAMQQMQAQMQMRMQMQQSWMAQQQIAYQKWMQKQQVIGQLSQQLMQIQYQMQMVMAGGTTGISAGGTIGTGSEYVVNPGIGRPGSTGTTPGAPTHTPISTPGGSSGGNDQPIQWR